MNGSYSLTNVRRVGLGIKSKVGISRRLSCALSPEETDGAQMS